MNIILIVLDTLRQDVCGCYGSSLGATPTIDALAKESAKLTHCLPASFPTGPMRKDLHFGRYTFPYHSWRTPVGEEEVSIGQVASKEGYRVGMVSDVRNSQFPYRIEDYNLVDCRTYTPETMPDWRKMKLPAKASKLRTPVQRLKTLLAHRASFNSEEEHCCARVFREAHRWIEEKGHGKKPFLLFVDSFDPHEPWNAPQCYVDLFDPGYKGDALFEPAYARADFATAREIRHMKALYAAKVALVDKWLGYFLEGVRRMGLWNDTAILLTSDHGFYHGEHGLIGKMELSKKDSRPTRRWPLYDTIMRVPLLIRVPGLRPRTSHALCQPPDIAATVVNLAGGKTPKRWHGQSLAPVLKGKSNRLRTWTLSSFTFEDEAELRTPTCFRTGRYLYVYGGDEWPHELFDIRNDPDQKVNIIKKQTAVANQLHSRFLTALGEIEARPESIALREDFMQPPRDVLDARATI
ncbi:MAG: sulfatase-like hydrolase/transferase [Planctomycetes bacterium]|nr:sulfatase-like hydrolase/transferase [Planctomycetota bacterium]